MIISLRGTNGSGKSHLVFQLMKRFKTTPIGKDKTGKPMHYRLDLSRGEQLYVVGPYTSACGGCDTIQPYDDIWPMVEEVIPKGHVLFEGSIVSSGYGRIGEATEDYGDSVVFVFLDTPVEKCVQNVVNRRLARGNEKPFDPKNVYQKYRAVELSVNNIANKHGRQIFILNHKKAVSQLLGLIYGTIELSSRSDPNLFPKTDHISRRTKS